MAVQESEKQQNTQQGQVRPPVVVVLGHVDHGKSSLLEAIREDFRITKKEAGGITQQIGAYTADYQDKHLTFIDTPGHEAFSAMRSRGAKVADIAILVVAADEGIKPQTVEAIQEIQKEQMPFVVALNKIDRPGANPERVKLDLAQHNVLVESIGGQVPSVSVSATAKQGITDLLDTILLLAELEDLKCDAQKPGTGVVLESSVDNRRGMAATLLVRDGTLRAGDWVATSTTWGKIRMMENASREQVSEAGPSTPVVAFGLNDVPKVGDEFSVFPDEGSAKAFMAEFAGEEPPARTPASFKAEQSLAIVLKADVAGSLEAAEGIIKELPTDNVGISIISSGVGEIGERDVKLAQSAEAMIIGFRVKAGTGIADLARRSGVPMITVDVIYRIVEALRKAMEQKLEPEIVQVEQARLQVLAVFSKEKTKQVIGGRVVSGELKKQHPVEVLREEEVLGGGTISNLQHNKEDVNTVAKGQEAGLLVNTEADIQAGDIIRTYIKEKRTIEL